MYDSELDIYRDGDRIILREMSTCIMITDYGMEILENEIELDLDEAKALRQYLDEYIDEIELGGTL